MKGKVKKRQSSHCHGGFSLVFAMTWIVICCTLISTLVYVARITLEMRIRQSEYLQAYVINNAAINRIRNSSTLSTNPCGSIRVTSVDGMTIACTSSVSRAATDVKVEVVDGSVKDTISFTYDTIAHRLTWWQDNGPGF